MGLFNTTPESLSIGVRLLALRTKLIIICPIAEYEADKIIVEVQKQVYSALKEKDKLSNRDKLWSKVGFYKDIQNPEARIKLCSKLSPHDSSPFVSVVFTTDKCEEITNIASFASVPCVNLNLLSFNRKEQTPWDELIFDIEKGVIVELIVRFILQILSM